MQTDLRRRATLALTLSMVTMALVPATVNATSVSGHPPRVDSQVVVPPEESPDGPQGSEDDQGTDHSRTDDQGTDHSRTDDQGTDDQGTDDQGTDPAATTDSAR